LAELNETYVAKRPSHVRLAQGHLSNAMPAAPWDFHPDMAGVGGVRATLPDMLRYLEGQLGTRESPITPALGQALLLKHAELRHLACEGFIGGAGECLAQTRQCRAGARRGCRI
jgi:hypothetical protein